MNHHPLTSYNRELKKYIIIFISIIIEINWKYALSYFEKLKTLDIILKIS